MQFGKLIFKDTKMKFEWWKIVVAGLTVTVAGLLFATYILSSISVRKKCIQEVNETYEINSIYYDQKTSQHTSLKISRMVLPMAQVYCTIQNCRVICSLIPAAAYPGIVAAVFVDSEYKSYCPDSVIIEELRFENCRFTENTLSLGWFPAKFQLKKLTLRRCSLTVIDSDAFHTEHFEVLSSLAIIGNKITILQKSVFDDVPNLEELTIINNVIKYADADLLAATSNTLQIIQIDNAIVNESVLMNITGGSQLPKVLLLSLTGNILKNISVDIFKGVPNVQSVYLTNSAVSSIEANALDPFSGSIRQLFLSYNKISSLPSNIFQSILKSNVNFIKLTLSNNDWNCNCELEWLKNFTSAHLIVADEPRCTSPESNAMLKFSEATFCRVEPFNDTDSVARPHGSANPIPTVTTTEPNAPENEVTGVNDNLITWLCPVDNETSIIPSRKLLAMQKFKFRSRVPDFSVEEKENGSVLVSLLTTRSVYTLIWFTTNLNGETPNFRGVQCITDISKSLYLNDLQPGSLYTICLLNKFGELTSPFNCLSLRKRSNYDDSLWLANKDKAMILSGLTVVLIIVCAVSVIGSYCVVRMNPKLLKGSKRIIMVRHRAADAIVLPEGLRMDLGTENTDLEVEARTGISRSRLSNQKDYMTPMSKRKLSTRRSSVISEMSSRSSANSYVSGIEPTNIQLMSWRIKRIRNNLSCNDPNESDDSPPPLPPPRNKSIPSISLNVDERETPRDPNSFSIFVLGDDRHNNSQDIDSKQIL